MKNKEKTKKPIFKKWWFWVIGNYSCWSLRWRWFKRKQQGNRNTSD